MKQERLEELARHFSVLCGWYGPDFCLSLCQFPITLHEIRSMASTVLFYTRNRGEDQPMKIDKKALIEKSNEAQAAIEKKAREEEQRQSTNDALMQNKFLALCQHDMDKAASQGERYCEVPINGYDKSRVVAVVSREHLQEFKTCFVGDGYTKEYLSIDWRD